MEVKNVPFLGSGLIAARDENGEIWAGVRWLCDGIGLSEGQRKRQIANIQTDRVLSKGGSNLVLPTNGGKQEVFCLKLDFVPLWLAKISITPKMENETPELVEKLEQYQFKAKDALAAAFLPSYNAMSDEELLSRAVMTAANKIKLLEEKIEQDRPKVEFADAVHASPTTIMVGDLAKLLCQNGLDTGQNRLFERLRNDGFLMRRDGISYNMPTQRSMNMGLFEINEECVTTPTGCVIICKTPRVTARGQAYFLKKYS